MNWLALLAAGLFEIGFAVALGRSDGFSSAPWVAVFAVCAIASFGLLSYAAKSIPIGTAYAVWTGIGAAGTAVVGMTLLGEPAQAARIVCVMLVLAGAVGLQLTSSAHG